MRHIKHIASFLTLICFLVMLGGIETSLWYGLLVIPFGALMYISGGCYEAFYERKRRR